jgi:hypothetical protein
VRYGANFEPAESGGPSNSEWAVERLKPRSRSEVKVFERVPDVHPVWPGSLAFSRSIDRPLVWIESRRILRPWASGPAAESAGAVAAVSLPARCGGRSLASMFWLRPKVRVWVARLRRLASESARA